MPLSDELRRDIVERLQRDEELPLDYQRLLFPPERRECELVYADKEREADILANTMAVPLQEVRTFGENGGEWHNRLIFGDNLQVMKTLLKEKEEGRLCNSDGTPGVRLIYIDPPFATKKEFRGGQDEKAYQDKIVGSRFVEFVRQRLVLMRELLAADGSIFVHLDQRKIHYLKIVLDEIFAENNFRNEIVLPGRASKNLQKQFDTISRLNVRHDTLLWYSRSAATRFSHLWVEKHKAGNPEGHWHHFWSNADRHTMRYTLFDITPQTGQWTWKEERALTAVANYERFLQEGGGRTLAQYWRDTGAALQFIRANPEDGTPQYWRAPAANRIADTVWAGVAVYGTATNYPTEKNEALLGQILELATEEGDLVLDAFAGSGTTCSVAEKLGRRWIAIDCGKLAVYTIQKRMLNLKATIGGRGKPLAAKPFTLYNAGLYDFSTIKKLPWADWRFFALQLFECRDEPHTIGGMELDGKRKGHSVLVYKHHEQPGCRIDEDTVRDIHLRIGDKVGNRFFLIAPKGIFDFQQDFLEMDDVRYYALRIPYSFIHELHNRGFTALRQPNDELAVNDIVDAYGFDFIQPPTAKWRVGIGNRSGNLIQEAYLHIHGFESRARVHGAEKLGGLETLSMLMLDYDYNHTVFDFDAAFYSDQLKEENWRAWFSLEALGPNTMAVFIDIYGNESQALIPRDAFQPVPDESAELSPVTHQSN